MQLILPLIVVYFLVHFSAATPKYSTPVEKVKGTITKGPPLPTNNVKNYVDFDLKSQSSRFGKEEHHHYTYSPYDHYYSSYEHTPYFYGKSHDLHHMLPYLIGGLGILLLPILTLLLTLAVNIAPASTIPTAVTTATGKFVDGFNSTKLIADFRDRLEAALSKYSKE